MTASDTLGFTSQELDRYLGHDESAPKHFLVQKKGHHTPEKLSKAQFEGFFDITYRPHLYFPSYKVFKDVVRNCPYILRSKTIASDNYAWTEKYGSQLSKGETIPLLIKWIHDEIGYGAFATANIAAGDYIGEYTGVVRRLLRRRPNPNGYCFHYPTRFWSLKYYVVDSLHEGNLMRFVNHSEEPNLTPLCLVEKNILHLVFVASRNIPKGTELTFDYGQDYWQTRKAHKKVQ